MSASGKSSDKRRHASSRAHRDQPLRLHCLIGDAAKCGDAAWSSHPRL